MWFDCFRNANQRRCGAFEALWRCYEARVRELTTAAEVVGAGEDEDSGGPISAAILNDQSRMEQFKCLVAAFCQHFLTAEQRATLAREDEPGGCVVVPREVHLPSKVHASAPVSPLALMARIRWPDLTSTKDLRRLDFLCNGGGGEKVKHAGRKSPPDIAPCKNAHTECCNPFHWSRQIQGE